MDESPVEVYGDTQSAPQAPAYGLPAIPPPPVEEPARVGPAGRLIGVLVSPGETFADVNRKPTWLVPMLIGVVIAMASGWFFNWWARPNYDRIIRKQVQTRSQKMGTQMPSEDVLAQQIKIGKTFASIGIFVFPIIFVPLFDLLVAAIFALEMMMIQAKTTFKKILSVYAWAGCGIGLVSTILLVAVTMVRDRDSLSEMTYQDLTNISPTNLGVLIQSSDSAVLKSIAGSIDLISIWMIIILTIGLVAISGNKKITKGKAAIVVLIPWVVWVLIKCGLSSLGLF